MSNIADNIKTVREKIPSHVRLVAVSKTKPVSDIMEAYNAGLKCFGENRVQELISKKDKLPDDIEWHLIGHLQSNKVRQVVPFIGLIQSVDSLRLLRIIDREASKISRVINCLLQIYIASEESKFGFSMDELEDIIEREDPHRLRNVRLCGVMGMATFTQDKDKIRKEFRYLATSFKNLKSRFFEGDDYFKEISMGMSGDYLTGLEEGSTMIRLGTLIFGDRTLNK